MRTLPFVPIAEAAFIAGLSDRQMSRVVDENLVPAALLGQQGSARLFARIRPVAAILMLPYLGWLIFAAALTYDIDRRNPDASAIAVPALRTNI